MQRKISRRTLIGAGVAGVAGVAGAGTVWALGHSAGSARGLVEAVAAPPLTAARARPVSVAITGDIMLSRSVNPRMVAAGADGLYPFAETADFLRGFDFTVGNLECVISPLGSPVDKGINFQADRIGFTRLKQAGFDLVSVANNHSGDYGHDAFADMLQRMPDYGVRYVGGGFNDGQADAVSVLERGGTRIGFVAACDIEPRSFEASSEIAGDVWLDEEALRRIIPPARPLCDFLIVFTHWGIEYVPEFNDQQQQLARLAIDLGADLVVGAHPHIIQPNEIYQGKPIIYSLGNFVFDQMPYELAYGNILTLQIVGKHLLEWHLVPTKINFDTATPSILPY